MMGLEPTTFCMASRRSSQLSYIRVPAQGTTAAVAVRRGSEFYGTMRIGVPTGTIRRIRRMSRLETRTHPWETAWPRSEGA